MKRKIVIILAFGTLMTRSVYAGQRTIEGDSDSSDFSSRKAPCATSAVQLVDTERDYPRSGEHNISTEC